MTKDIIIRVILLSVFSISYLIFTIRHFRWLQKNIVFTYRVKVFHLIMIWLIPFVWAFLLKGLTKPIPGSHEIAEKTDPKPFSDGGGTMWNSSG